MYCTKYWSIWQALENIIYEKKVRLTKQPLKIRMKTNWMHFLYAFQKHINDMSERISPTFYIFMASIYGRN